MARTVPVPTESAIIPRPDPNQNRHQSPVSLRVGAQDTATISPCGRARLPSMGSRGPFRLATMTESRISPHSRHRHPAETQLAEAFT